MSADRPSAGTPLQVASSSSGPDAPAGGDTPPGSLCGALAAILHRHGRVTFAPDTSAVIATIAPGPPRTLPRPFQRLVPLICTVLAATLDRRLAVRLPRPLRASVSVDRLNAARQLDHMQFIELDGSEWSERLDFWNALREALGVVPEHGTSIDAFIDSIFYHPELLRVPPPFLILVKRPHPTALADVEQMSAALAEARQDYDGDDIQASILVAATVN